MLITNAIISQQRRLQVDKQSSEQDENKIFTLETKCSHQSVHSGEWFLMSTKILLVRRKLHSAPLSFRSYGSTQCPLLFFSNKTPEREAEEVHFMTLVFLMKYREMREILVRKY